jgi:CRP-like cAMP-binding protein
MEDSFEITTNALVGSAQGTLALHVRLGGDGGFLHTGKGNAPVPADTLVDRALLLHELPMLRGAGVQEITDIARASDVIEVREGEWLWQPGAPPGATFAVAAGTVVVEHAKPRVAARFGPGSIVGGAVSLGDAAGAWSARAATDATVVTFSNELWLDQMEEHVDLARVAMGSLAIEREHLFDLLARETGEIVLR